MGAISPVAFRAWWMFGLLALILGTLTVQAYERYTREYQSFPALDWLDAHPPLDQSASIPSAAVLTRALLVAVPYLRERDAVLPFAPSFGPPGVYERLIGGVRDAATVTASTVGAKADPRADRVVVTLGVIVFHRGARADDWRDLTAMERDMRRLRNGPRQHRTSGPDSPDYIWVTEPSPHLPDQGVATVVGTRGPVAFKIQVRSSRPSATDTSDAFGLTGRAELVAREVAARWTAWLATATGLRA